MALPLLLIHGYSATSEAFTPLRQQLIQRGIASEDINIANYVSLNNEVTIKDLAEGFDRALRSRATLANEDQPFDAIVHSTGMLIIRSWLTNYGAAKQKNSRLRRLKHLIGLAPATWGSPQAHKGRTWIGVLIKGNRAFGPDFLNAGDCVLDGLELGSSFTWQLAHSDLLTDPPHYDTGGDTPYVSVFIGNRGYDGLASVANDPGTDGTVRWAGCALNTRKIILDLTRMPDGPRVTISKWANDRLDIPMIPVDGKSHETILSAPDPGMMDLILGFLKVNSATGYETWLTSAKAYGSIGRAAMLAAGGNPVRENTEGWQQLVVHARDERGDGVSDFILDVLTLAHDGTWIPFEQMYTDVHAYGADQSYRCFHIRLPAGVCENRVPLRIRVHASTGTELMTYQGYVTGAQQLSAASQPVELDVGSLGANNDSLFHPFTTTLIEIILNREPVPPGRIFGFVPPV